MPEKKSAKEDQEAEKTLDQPTAQGAVSPQRLRPAAVPGAQGRPTQVAPLSRPQQEELRRKLRAKYH